MTNGASFLYVWGKVNQIFSFFTDRKQRTATSQLSISGASVSRILVTRRAARMRTTYRQATNPMTTMTSARPEVRHDLGAQYPRQKTRCSRHQISWCISHVQTSAAGWGVLRPKIMDVSWMNRGIIAIVERQFWSTNVSQGSTLRGVRIRSDKWENFKEIRNDRPWWKVFNIQNCSVFTYISSCFPWYFNTQTIDVTVVPLLWKLFIMGWY